MDSETINFCKPEQVRAIHPGVGEGVKVYKMNTMALTKEQTKT